MSLRFPDRVKFAIERQFVKGAGFQLLVVMVAIGLISVVGGLLVAPTGEPFDDLGTAIWWAFLRLTDPGYLGDDEGSWRRFVSTLLTVSGYVVFLGALVAIMTRKLIAIMDALERGLTPVAFQHHIVVLGWNSRTLPLLRELLGSTGRVRRFLERNDARRLRLVVLSEKASASQRLELKAEPGIGAKEKQVVLRSGLAIQPDALHRVACLDAAAVILPSSSQGPDSLVTSDVETVKALLSIAAQARLNARTLPLVVAEIQDMRKRSVVERAYPGAVEVIAGDATISRLLTQNILHPGLSEVFNELLTGSKGNAIYVRSGDILPGADLQTLASRCPRAVVMGLLRPESGGWKPMLLADSKTQIQKKDCVVLIARTYADTQPDLRVQPRSTVSRRALETSAPLKGLRASRVLVLGWNSRVPSLMSEFSSYTRRRFEVDIVSVIPAMTRDQEIREYADSEITAVCRHIEADYRIAAELRRLEPQHYDSILLLSSDRLASGEEADARTMMGYLQLDDLLAEGVLVEGGAAENKTRPQLIMELCDPDNESLLTVQQSEMLVSPLIISHVLAQVALRREFRVVFDELFTVGGAEIMFRDQGCYALGQDADFQAFEHAAARQGEIGLGVYRCVPDAEGQRLQLNPDRSMPLALAEGDQLLVLGIS
ncbi:MAG: ion channel DMI1 [Alteromonadaceae bacterium]|nr:ion channel DMI1 [Alteromonadaceae bacterium]